MVDRKHNLLKITFSHSKLLLIRFASVIALRAHFFRPTTRNPIVLHFHDFASAIAAKAHELCILPPAISIVPFAGVTSFEAMNVDCVDGDHFLKHLLGIINLGMLVLGPHKLLPPLRHLALDAHAVQQEHPCVDAVSVRVDDVHEGGGGGAAAYTAKEDREEGGRHETRPGVARIAGIARGRNITVHGSSRGRAAANR